MDSKPWQARPLVRWLAGLAAAALLVGTGVVIGAHLTATTAPSSTKSVLTASTDRAVSSMFGTQATVTSVSAAELPAGASTGLRADLAGLRKCLATARRLAWAGHLAAARALRLACIRKYHAGGLLLVRRLFLLGAEHGVITFQTKKGTVTVAFERGVIQDVVPETVSGSVVVEAADGSTLTWELISKTVIVQAKKLASVKALAVGQRVFVVGAVVGGADDARLIIVRG
jgi:hypothetical protein